MGTNSKREYLLAIRARYHRVGRRFKSKILDEFCAVCGYQRKYAIRLLHQPPQRPRRRPGPTPRYDAQLRQLLKIFWLATDQLCSKRLKVALPLWLPYYEQTHGPLAPQLKDKLLAISPAQMDRLLRPIRAATQGRGLSGTKPGSLLKRHIPIHTASTDLTVAGHLEADAVAHCGGSLEGDFIWSLTFTDIASGWTENRAIWNKGAHDILAHVRRLESQLPFALRSFDVDNGAEFLNHHLWRYFFDRPTPIEFARSRPYHKNDQAHVEQKNWTHVRQLLGYDRLAEPTLVPLLNDLYETAWGPFHNFFCPSVKLQQKKRVGAQYVKHHDRPQTPYQRLLQSDHVTEEHKAILRERFAQLNPFTLKQAIEEKLRAIFRRLRCTAI